MSPSAPTNAFDAFADGFFRPRGVAYLDAAATSLMHEGVYRALGEYYSSACANPHTDAHGAGRTSTALMEQTRARLASLIQMPSTHCLMFIGNGATAALNRAARAIFRMYPDGIRGNIIVTGAEHHANILPWQALLSDSNAANNTDYKLIMIPMREDGSFNETAYLNALAKSPVALVCVTWVSNVTGAVLPVAQICAAAKQSRAITVVDAAQAAPHLPVRMTKDMDFLAFSGHKLYSPGSPGVLVGPAMYFQGTPVGDLGGGTVESVNSAGIHWKDRVEEREEAGTPNVPGVVSLGIVAAILERVGMQAIRQHDIATTSYLLQVLRNVPGLIIYGSDKPGGVDRAGVVAFNLENLSYNTVARVLDSRGIAVRNACFCAHPYVRRMLAENPLPASPYRTLTNGREERPGMVRASVGPWTTREDLDKLGAALLWMSQNPDLAIRVEQVGGQCFNLEDAASLALR